MFEDEGLGFIVYKRLKMIYWSNNHFAFQNILNKVSEANKLVILPNGVYLTQARIIGNFEIIGLIHIKNNYSYENQFLENSYIPPFKVPASYKINISRVTNATEIHDSKDQYLFTILPTSEEAYSEMVRYIPALLYLLGFILLLILLYRKTERYNSKYFVVKMALLLLTFVVVYWLHIRFKIPGILNHIDLFSAQFYAVSDWLPSLGDFFLITVLFFFWSLVFSRDFSPSELLRKKMIIPAFVFYRLVVSISRVSD